MSEPTSKPTPYKVAYSEAVRSEARRLIAVAATPEEARRIIAAFRSIDHRLRIFPQFGEPLLDLKHETGRMWIGVIDPVVIRYAVFEERRLVMVGILPELLQPKTTRA